MHEFPNDDATITYDVTGDGPPVLLLHGFPQTREMWEPILPALAGYTVVTPDLRGYGASTVPPGAEHMTFRKMAADGAALMRHLGHDTFHLIGHDRGARVAHRLALDTPQAVRSLVLMDIVPTLHLLENWNFALATAYWHWSFLALPAPFPDDVVLADPDRFFGTCLTSWGGATEADFPAFDAHRRAWQKPETVRAMIDDYRAAPVLDRAHDEADRGRKVEVPSLVLYGASGVMAKHFDVRAVWAGYLADFETRAIPGGHFFIDQSPAETGAALKAFLDAHSR